jgi:hypothetical protein
MTLHAAKGAGVFFEFSWVDWKKACFLIREHFCSPTTSRGAGFVMLGMTRAMDTLILTRAVYRRRWHRFA